MNIIPLTKESKTYSGWSTQRKNLQSCKNHLNKENLNEFKGGTLMKKVFSRRSGNTLELPCFKKRQKSPNQETGLGKNSKRIEKKI